MYKRRKAQTTMDKFLVRPASPPPEDTTTTTTPAEAPRDGVLRQATLESLRGVVVVEEMERAKVVLERKDVSSELKVDTLQHLMRKTPAKEVLVRTKLGRTVHKLCRHQNTEVAAAARQVYTAWKTHIMSKTNRPYIEVKCDLKTQRRRDTARKMLLEAVQKETEEGGGGGGGGRDRDVDHKSNRIAVNIEDCKSSKDSDRLLEGNKTRQNIRKPKQKHDKEKSQGNSQGKAPTHKRPREGSDTETHACKEEEEEDKGEAGRSDGATSHEKPREEEGKASVAMLAEHLEREVYHNTHRRADNSYQRSMRSLVFALRNQEEVRKAVTSATLSVKDFVKQHMKS